MPLVYAWREDEAGAILRIDIGADGRPALRLIPLPAEGCRHWVAPFAVAGRFEIEVAVHTGGGPGGVMARPAGGAWQSMTGDGARGAEGMDWPPLWCAGRDPGASLPCPEAMPEVILSVTAMKPAARSFPVHP